jgi:hypothetical protein
MDVIQDEAKPVPERFEWISGGSDAALRTRRVASERIGSTSGTARVVEDCRGC